MNNAPRHADNRLLRLVGVTLWLVGVLCSGCTDLPRSTDTDDAMTSSITDTAAVYQVHGIRFAVPSSLSQKTREYGFIRTFEEPNQRPPKHLGFLPTSSTSPDSIYQILLEATEAESKHVTLLNRKEEVIGNHRYHLGSFRYNHPSGSSGTNEDYPARTRADYALLVNEEKSETWVFYYSTDDRSFSEKEEQEWRHLLASVSLKSDTSTTFIGWDHVNSASRFHTVDFHIAVPEEWTFDRQIEWIPAASDNRPPRPSDKYSIRRASIVAYSTSIEVDAENRTVEDKRKLASDLLPAARIEERHLNGQPVDWLEIDPSVEQGRFRSIYRTALLKVNQAADREAHVYLKLEVEYEIDDPGAPVDPPEEGVILTKSFDQIYHSISF